MGFLPPSTENSILPFGFIYALTQAGIPVQWVINPSKIKDGEDFSHNGVSYRGSAFIIDAGNLIPGIQALITEWETYGMEGDFTVTEITVPVYTTIYTFPLTTVDAGKKASIIEDYFKEAGIPEIVMLSAFLKTWKIRLILLIK